ncbi:MAG: 50S ribosomal protein L30 [Thermoplasmatota archaeon]
MFAVLRIRSPRSKSYRIEDTLDKLRINKVNHCTIVPEDDAHKGMLMKIKDIITWGEVDKETLSKLIEYRSTLNEDVEKRIKDQTSYEDIEDFAEGVLSGEIEIDEIEGLKNLFRLHPPKGGYKSVKKPYKTGGSLGYRSQDINELLKRMLGPEYVQEE